MNQLTVLVLSGGISHEREISLRSGRRVSDALEQAGYRVRNAEPDADLLRTLQSDRPDVVFPALHGASGEDGALLGLLEALNVPYVGSSAAAALRAWSKPTARHTVAEAGVAVPAGLVLTRDAFRELSAPGVLEVVAATNGFPLVVKPGHGGSAQGVSIVTEPEGLARALVDAFTYADTAVCETFVAGTEVAVSVIETDEGASVLPPVEIVPLNGVYGFEARYNAGETRFFAPARLAPDVLRRLEEAALIAHRALALRDVSRIDFIVDQNGCPWFLEANVIPGMTETSLLPLALDAAGILPSDAYGRLVQRAAAR